MNLFEKMAAIRDEAGVIAKNLEIQTGTSGKYKAVGERDVLDAIRPLMEMYKVYAYPIERSCDDKGQIVSTTKYGEKTNLYFHYRNVMRFVNIEDSKEFIDVVSYSTGLDSGDKADGKAMTYADKYAYMKAFMLSTGDDPDQEESEEYKTAKASDKQVAYLRKLYNADETAKMLAYYKVNTLEELPKDVISKYINDRSQYANN